MTLHQSTILFHIDLIKSTIDKKIKTWENSLADNFYHYHYKINMHQLYFFLIFSIYIKIDINYKRYSNKNYVKLLDDNFYNRRKFVGITRWTLIGNVWLSKIIIIIIIKKIIIRNVYSISLWIYLYFIFIYTFSGLSNVDGRTLSFYYSTTKVFHIVSLFRIPWTMMYQCW